MASKEGDCVTALYRMKGENGFHLKDCHSHESRELVNTNRLLRSSSSHQQLLEAYFFKV